MAVVSFVLLNPKWWTFSYCVKGVHSDVFGSLKQ